MGSEGDAQGGQPPPKDRGDRGDRGVSGVHGVRGARRPLPILRGVLPVERSRVPAEILAGVTLAALAIPEVMGYTSIAGMPVITGLYTLLLPMTAFAVLGSSRHLVVGADSATAAVTAAGLAGLAAAGSAQYVALASLLALMAAVLLILARLIRLGFLADFLSRTVLVGFLAGVGVAVASGQVGGMLGIPEGSGVTVDGHFFSDSVAKLASTLSHLADTSLVTVAVTASVVVVIVGTRFVTRAVPGALVAVVGSMIVSWYWDLASHGVATIGKVPGGLPHLALPAVTRADVTSLFGPAISVFVLILAQSAATSRAYAAKNDEDVDENMDLVALGAANFLAAVSGTFVVNGSPTKTQMVENARGRSQLAQISTAVIVGVVLVFLTAPIQYMPTAVLAAVVFVIGIELVDVRAMRRILSVRTDEFAVATLTALTVILFGVEQGVVLAVVASVINHLRRSYRPPVAVMQPAGPGRGWHGVAATPGTRTEPGLVVYRFGGSIYYANAAELYTGATAFLTDGAPDALRWFCLDAAMIPDVDYTGGQLLQQLHRAMEQHHVRLVVAQALTRVKAELLRYGLVELFGEDAFFETIPDVVTAFHHRPDAAPDGP